MPKITIYYSAIIKEVTDKSEDSLETGDTIESAITELIEKYGEGIRVRLLANEGEIHENIIVTLNGRNIKYIDNLATKLNDGDEITIIPLVAGG